MKFDRKFGQKSTIHQNPGWSVFVNHCHCQPLASIFTFGFGFFLPLYSDTFNMLSQTEIAKA